MSSLRCTYCQEDICSVGLNCVECEDFNLCLQCASCGVEVGEHKKDHDYKVADNGRFPVFQTSTVWTAAEEMLLLDAIEQYGYGNWDDTSAYVGTKTSDEVKEHYHSLYINGNIGKVTLPKEHATDIADHTVVSGGPLSPSLSTRDGGLEITNEDYHLLGYMPLRDDFEREYDNEAETLVSGLMETQEDDELDAAVKLTQVDMYSRRLRERARRKRIIHDYGLVQEFFNLNNGKQKSPAKRKISKEEKDFQDKMKGFAQFQSATEQEQFFTELQHEKQLKSRVKELMRFRKNGLTKLSEIEDYERAKLLREKRKESQKKAVTNLTNHKNNFLRKEKFNNVINHLNNNHSKARRKKRKKVVLLPRRTRRR